MIRTGVVLPTFRATPADALEVAFEAFEAGVDGVFCYDHLWPIGQPERPALAPFPILAALAAQGAGAGGTGGRQGYLGTLVARVGLVPSSVLVAQFTALEHLAPGRVIAGLGTGDHLSEGENRGYGIPFTAAAERRVDMVGVARTLKGAGLTVWLAAGTAARVVEAHAAGVAINLWDADPALVALVSDGPEAVEVTWGGPPPATSIQLHATVQAVARAGATWAIFGWPIDLDDLVAAAEEAEAAPPP